VNSKNQWLHIASKNLTPQNRQDKVDEYIRITVWQQELGYLNETVLRRYQRGNHNPYIEEEQRIQWQKEKVQKEKQRC